LGEISLHDQSQAEYPAAHAVSGEEGNESLAQTSGISARPTIFGIFRILQIAEFTTASWEHVLAPTNRLACSCGTFAPPIAEYEIRDLEEAEGSEQTHATPGPRASAEAAIHPAAARPTGGRIAGDRRALGQGNRAALCGGGRNQLYRSLGSVRLGRGTDQPGPPAGLLSMREYFSLLGLKKDAGIGPSRLERPYR
jgi:hypothetical protein